MGANNDITTQCIILRTTIAGSETRFRDVGCGIQLGKLFISTNDATWPARLIDAIDGNGDRNGDLMDNVNEAGFTHVLDFVTFNSDA